MVAAALVQQASCAWSIRREQLVPWQGHCRLPLVQREARPVHLQAFKRCLDARNGLFLIYLFVLHTRLLLQAFVPVTAAVRPQRRARVMCAAQQAEGTSRRAALQQAAGLAATLLLSRQGGPQCAGTRSCALGNPVLGSAACTDVQVHAGATRRMARALAAPHPIKSLAKLKLIMPTRALVSRHLFWLALPASAALGVLPHTCLGPSLRP